MLTAYCILLIMVFYRKYRPQKISELDLPNVREKLSAVLSSKDFPHAFLFTGSKGLGKTSAARILAKAINCTGQKEEKSNSKHQSPISQIEPCNKCEACVSITNGSNIDVLEIDGASNGGVEEIRNLREKVKFASSSLKKKVYIIDEVHMLSTGAFNALLKTLEEPPAHVVFILATTELHKLPPTVVSRTFHVNFEKPTNDEIVKSLERIVKGENLDVEKGVLESVASISDGAFRDSAKNLEELVFASKGKKITNELFDDNFKTGGVKEEVAQLLMAYSEKDAKKALQIISKFAKNGADFKVVIERIVDHLRGLLMMRNDIKSEEPDIENLSLGDINELLNLSNEAFSELRQSIIPSLPLELMTVKFCILDNGEDQKEKSKKEKEEIEVDEKVESINAKELSSANKSNKKLLPLLIEELNKINKPGAALLRSASDADLKEGVLTIFTPFPIHAERLMSDKVLPDLKKTSNEIAGKVVEIAIKITP